MARDINSRLDKLRLRRKGIDRLGRLNEASRNEVLSKSVVAEKWQTRAPAHAYTRYALGAMQEVGPEYTRISIETAERVYELRILAEVQRHLDYLYHNPEEAKKLRVPDGSRVVFDTQEKYEGMKALSNEIDDLVKNVAKEQRPQLTFDLGVPWGVARDAIDSIEIPG